MSEVKKEDLIRIVVTTHHTKTQVILAEIDREDQQACEDEGVYGLGYLDGSDLGTEAEGYNVKTLKVLDEYESSCDCANTVNNHFCSNTVKDYNVDWCEEHEDRDDCNEKSGMFDGIKIIKEEK
jgi:hypothetical protein